MWSILFHFDGGKLLYIKTIEIWFWSSVLYILSETKKRLSIPIRFVQVFFRWLSRTDSFFCSVTGAYGSISRNYRSDRFITKRNSNIFLFLFGCVNMCVNFNEMSVTFVTVVCVNYTEMCVTLLTQVQSFWDKMLVTCVTEGCVKIHHLGDAGRPMTHHVRGIGGASINW